MPERKPDTAALFVRIPEAQARALDRLAFESGRSKQAVVSELLSHSMGSQPVEGRPVRGREREPLVGWHSFRAYETDVLTLEGVAELLAVEPEVIAELASRGELPGRRIGGAWRFARSAVLEWLAAGASGSMPAQGDQ